MRDKYRERSDCRLAPKRPDLFVLFTPDYVTVGWKS